MKYNRETLIRRYDGGEKLSYVPFWGHTEAPGKVRKTCMSQWYECWFEIDGVRYHTTEQYMMAQKAILFNDTETLSEIMAADEPKAYKKLGRKVGGFVPEVWDANKFDIVLRGNLAKFGQNPELWAYLDGTGDSVLVEASPYDGIWGVKLDIADARIENPRQWGGENLLGFALMEARDILRERKKQ